MPEGSAESQCCALPGCDETIVQPQDGGPPRLYCTHEHRATARKQRRVARFEVNPVPTPAAISRTATTRPAEQVPSQASRPRIATPWIADPFSLPPDIKRNGGRLTTGASE